MAMHSLTSSLTYLQTLLEQIELLKVTKMDREDVIEAMADKVDLQMLTRKVSRDQFETACDDLAKGLENTLEKLNMQVGLPTLSICWTW